MSLFRKPKRNVRQRQVDSDEDEVAPNGSGPPKDDDDQDDALKEMQSNIEKLKEIKKKAANKKKEGVSSTVESADKKTSLLSFDNFEAEADDGEVFRVKKSSQSRRLMKQKRAERRHKDRVGDDAPPLPCDEDLPLPNGLPPPPLPPMPPPPPVIDDDDIGIRVKNNLVINNKTDNVRMLSGYEAEALHMEDEDLNDESEEEKDPLQEILQSGAIPDAAAIYAARKRRQAVRERGAKIPDNKDNNGSQRDFIALNADRRSARSKDHEEDDSGDEESRIVMAGVRSNAALREESIKAVIEVEEEEADHARWEDQQIRKAMKVGGAAAKSGTASPDYDDLSSPNPNRHIIGRERYPHHEAPASYNLEGIKDRLKKRLTLLDEVHKRHTSDADKIADELFASQTSIDERQARLPEVIRRHHFYQDLRGYVTDLVECYDEKLNNIKYVEERYHKSKSDMCQKMIERRRDDVRDQMRELSTNAVKPLQMTAEESNEEWARQRRAAEREGRRRRRAQLRSAKAGQMPPHNDGMSSDDELPSHDQATVAKSRQDVENQARTIMSDVVEEFSTIGGVLNRIQEWKETDPSAYDDAFVSLCLPKIVSPLVTLQLLFWNPIEEHTNLEDMGWYANVALYSHNQYENDRDEKLLSLVMEKVVLVKINGIVRAAYDPMSTSQTLKLTQLLGRLKGTYPTLTGASKQVRELLKAVMDKLKACVDHDVYIPLGYSKQYLENPLSGHTMFLSRQFWGCFKLFRNVMCWHGILADRILVDLAVNSLLNRYLIIGLGVSPIAMDSVNKCRHIVSALPSEWRTSKHMRSDFERLIGYLVALSKTPGLSRDSVRELARLLRSVNAINECETVERTLLQL